MKKSFYVMSNGALRRKDNTLFLHTDAGKRFIPVEGTGELHIFGEVDVTKKFLEFISQQGILVHFYNYFGYYVGSFYPREHYNSGYMTLAQAEHYLDESKRLVLAKLFVQGALENIRVVLRYYDKRFDQKFTHHIKTLDDRLAQVPSTDKIADLMAIEGNCRELYYSCWDAIVKQPKFVFQKRSRRPPQNRMNALISFGNTLLYTTILSEIYKTHLDPRVGYLHATNFRRFTLNLDVAEVFKPIVVDRLIFRLLSRKQMKSNHFSSEAGGIYLKEAGRNIFVAEFEKQLRTTIRHRELNRNISYRSLIRRELYKIQKHIMGETTYTPHKTRW